VLAGGTFNERLDGELNFQHEGLLSL
jgi:hypothetical protein